MSKIAKTVVDHGYIFFSDALQEMSQLKNIKLDDLTVEKIYLLQRLTTSSMYDVVRITIAENPATGKLFARDYTPAYSFCGPSALEAEIDSAIYIRDDICPEFAIRKIRHFLKRYENFINLRRISDNIVVDERKSPKYEEKEVENNESLTAHQILMMEKGLHYLTIPTKLSHESAHENKWQKKYRKNLTEMYQLRRLK